LPLLSGFSELDSEKLKEALGLIELWENSPLHKFSQVSSMYWNPERGFRALISYSMGGGGRTVNAASSKQARAMVDLGQEIDHDLERRFIQLSQVFSYLRDNSIAARQIWAGGGKKVVVKSAHGS